MFENKIQHLFAHANFFFSLVTKARHCLWFIDIIPYTSFTILNKYKNYIIFTAKKKKTVNTKCNTVTCQAVLNIPALINF